MVHEEAKEHKQTSLLPPLRTREVKATIRSIGKTNNHFPRLLTLFGDEAHEYIDWLNKNHFDYRGLIEKGLALVAVERKESTTLC